MITRRYRGYLLVEQADQTVAVYRDSERIWIFESFDDAESDIDRWLDAR